MCQPLLQYGVLKRRHDWNLKLQEFFANDNGQEFVSGSVLLNLSRQQFHMDSYGLALFVFPSFLPGPGETKDLPCGACRAEETHQSTLPVRWNRYR